MILTLHRFNRDAKSTLGLLNINGHFECFILEDAERCEKISGETAIPVGRYQIKFRKEDTPLTKKYRQNYDWFTHHLQIMDIPNYQWVYIHIGNWPEDTEGCLLVGDVAEADPAKMVSHIEKSAQAFERVYKQISDTLDRKEEVWIIIE